MRIEEYSPRWQAKVGALADRVLGTGFFESPSQIQRDSESCVFVAIDKEDEVAGFIRGQVLPKGGLRDFLEHRLPDIPEDLDKADAEGALGVIQTVVVAPEHRDAGAPEPCQNLAPFARRHVEAKVMEAPCAERAPPVERFRAARGVL